jgi:hypothetical protein
MRFLGEEEDELPCSFSKREWIVTEWIEGWGYWPGKKEKVMVKKFSCGSHERIRDNSGIKKIWYNNGVRLKSQSNKNKVLQQWWKKILFRKQNQ